MNIKLSLLAMLCAVLGSLNSAFAEDTPTDISGVWKIDTLNGPTPLCEFKQAGNYFTGSCAGPKAAGTITGTTFGKQVHWHWQWVTYAGNAASGFDFTGTLKPDNTITGMLERRDVGLSFYFAAKRPPAGSNQSLSQFVDDFNARNASNLSVGVVNAPPAVMPTPSGAAGATLPQYRNNSLEESRAYYAKGPSPAVIAAARQMSPDFANLSDNQIRQRLVPSPTRQGMQQGEWIDRQSGVAFLGDARPISLEQAWNNSEASSNIGDTGIDPQIEARALKLFPRASQENERTKYITDEMNAAADRQQGNSYSIHVH